MDMNKLKLLGFIGQHSKPKVCRDCQVNLIPNINWYKSTMEHGKRLCNKCSLKKGEDWRKFNPDKQKILNSRANKKSVRNTSSKWSRGRSVAKYRGMGWSLTKEEYILLVNKRCHYCTHQLDEAGIGLDQIVPKRGYTKENVVPCCGECNTAKSDHFSYDEMLLIGKVIKEIKDRRKLENKQNSIDMVF